MSSVVCNESLFTLHVVDFKKSNVICFSNNDVYAIIYVTLDAEGMDRNRKLLVHQIDEELRLYLYIGTHAK